MSEKLSSWPFRWKPGFVIEAEEQEYRRRKREREREEENNRIEEEIREMEKRQEEERKIKNKIDNLYKVELAEFYKDYMSNKAKVHYDQDSQKHLLIMKLLEKFCEDFSKEKDLSEICLYYNESYYNERTDCRDYPYTSGTGNDDKSARYRFDKKIREEFDRTNFDYGDREDWRNQNWLITNFFSIRGVWENCKAYFDVRGNYGDITLPDQFIIDFQDAIKIMNFVLDICAKQQQENRREEISKFLEHINDETIS